jgi:hypothetical protein
MSRFNQIKHPAGNPELEGLYKEIIELGFEGSEPGVPNNLVTSLSERPDLLAATWAIGSRSVHREANDPDGHCHAE